MKLSSIIYILLTLSLLIRVQVLACTCPGFEKAGMDTLREKVDFVLVGKPVTVVNRSNDLNALLSKEGKGINILFKVDSVLKGDLLNDTIYINQEVGGSCSRVFEFGESYIVFGYKINKFVHMKRKSNKTKTVSPPYPPILKKSELVVDGWDDELLRFYNQQASKYVTIATNLCLTFYKDSEMLEYISK